MNRTLKEGEHDQFLQAQKSRILELIDLVEAPEIKEVSVFEEYLEERFAGILIKELLRQGDFPALATQTFEEILKSSPDHLFFGGAFKTEEGVCVFLGSYNKPDDGACPEVRHSCVYAI